MYRRARQAFGLEYAPYVEGQINPLRVGIVLKNMGLGDRELTGVRVYRGLPSSKHDPKGYSACSRQVALWQKQALVTAVTRPVNYRDPERPIEKGVDVSIAIDFVRMAVEKEVDVGILFSGDTDLLPALEAVADLKGADACEVAGWVPSDGSSPGVLRLKGKLLRTHYLDRRVYTHTRDGTNYNAQRRRR